MRKSGAAYNGHPSFRRNTIVSDTFAGLVRGDRVRILGLTGIMEKYGQYTYEFLAHYTDIDTGRQWLSLWGGKPKYEGMMAVRPNQVVRARVRSRRPKVDTQ